MASEKAARRYASAVLQLASERRDIAETGRDLHAIADAIATDDATKAFFISPVVDRGAKEALLLRSFQGRVGEIALHTLLLLVRKRRESLLAEIVRQFDALEMQARGVEPLTISSAKPLPKDELAAIVTRLERAYGRTFHVTERVVPDLIGGIRMMMGDRRIDGTIAGRLDELSRTLSFSR